MKQKTTIVNIIKILLSAAILFLSGLAFYALVIKQEIAPLIRTVFQLNTTPDPVIIVLVGMLILVCLLGITFLFTTHKSLDSLFHWMLLFLAFSTLPDLSRLVSLADILRNDLKSAFILDFSMIDNLYLLWDFPKELVLLLILLFCMTRMERFHIKKKETVLLALSLLLCFSMLFLPQIAFLMIFVAVYFIILTVHGLYREFMMQLDKRYEKILAYSILAVLVGKCIYRALLLINAYLI